MARIRTIKPEFWSDGTLMECSLNARLLFIGTWNFADDNGNLDRSAKQLKARIFPADNIDCEPLIQELLTHGRLIEYSVSGQKYLHIHKFKEHQVINRPSKPQCPLYEDSLRTPGGLPDDSAQKGREGKGEEGKGKDKPPVAPLALPGWLSVETWEAYVKTRPVRARKPEALKGALQKLESFRAEGHDPNEIIATSLANGWQGLFAPSEKRGAKPVVVASRPSIVCSTCNQRAFTWTDGQCDPCWRKSQGMAA